jgi:division/cell wall cluster transcriptional repressor MraZ
MRFFGEYYLKYQRGGIIFPKTIAAELSGKHIVVNRGFDQCLNIYLEEKFERVKILFEKLDMADPQVFKLARMFYRGAHKSRVTAAGKFLVPEPLIQLSKIKHECTLICLPFETEGLSPNFELWDSKILEQELGDFSNFEELARNVFDKSSNEDKLVGFSTELIIPETSKLVTSISTSKIEDYLNDHKNRFKNISPRDFEIMVAEILSKMGYDIELTQATSDGGVDIYAAKNSEMGNFLYLVECKHYQKQHVGVEILRTLYGVVEDKKATAGLLVTSSYFSQPAIDFSQRNEHRLKLADYYKVLEWIKTIRGD